MYSDIYSKPSPFHDSIVLLFVIFCRALACPHVPLITNRTNLTSSPSRVSLPRPYLDMSTIFQFDDVSQLCQGMRDATLDCNPLNYKILEEDGGEGDEFYDEEEPVAITAETIPIPINNRNRRNSAIALSYELGIGGSSYVLRILGSGGLYKPRLLDFEPLKVLGQGSYGKVLLVREMTTGRLFAQKQLKKASLIINENTNEINQTNYKRTMNEKQILEMVNHPNIVKLYYAFQDNNKLYLILEYISGGELFHHLAQERFMTEKSASFYIAQMILALRYLHGSLKVIYRDLKPENCLLNSNGHLVLTDFGLLKEVDGGSQRHSITGTAQYMAPEIIKGEEYDYQVDWWSLGCVAYDLLVGLPPFTGSSPQKIMDKIVAAAEKNNKQLRFPFYVSNDAKNLLRQLLQVNPEKRLNVDEQFEKVKKHEFFRHVNWKELERLNPELEIMPPIMPIITDPVLAENFDSDFTDMAFTPHTATSYLGNDILHLQGFSYTNESLLEKVLETTG